MSLDDVKKFFEKVEGDKELQKKLKALGEKKKAQDEAARAEMITVAAAAGFKFTAAHLAEARKEAVGEMSVEDLKKVAGGKHMCPDPLPYS